VPELSLRRHQLLHKNKWPWAIAVGRLHGSAGTVCVFAGEWARNTAAIQDSIKECRVVAAQAELLAPAGWYAVCI